jgi:hypothetical protein
MLTIRPSGVPHWGLVNPTAFMGLILEKEPLFSPVEHQFLTERYQPFDANPDQLPFGIWLQATDSVRFSTNSLSTQKMFEFRLTTLSK